MSLETYRVLHIFGVVTLFSGLASLWGLYVSRPAGVTTSPPYRVGLVAFHGVGLLVLLVSGFGMLARLGLLGGIPLWAYAKVVIWLVLGGSVALAKRKSAWGLKLVSAWIALGTLAAYLCIFKPD